MFKASNLPETVTGQMTAIEEVTEIFNASSSIEQTTAVKQVKKMFEGPIFSKELIELIIEKQMTAMVEVPILPETYFRFLLKNFRELTIEPGDEELFSLNPLGYKIICQAYFVNQKVWSYLVLLGDEDIPGISDPQTYSLRVDCTPNLPKISSYLFDDYIDYLTDLREKFCGCFTQALDEGSSMFDVLNQLRTEGLWGGSHTFFVDKSEERDFDLEGDESTIFKDLVEFHKYNTDPRYQVAPEISQYTFTKDKKITNKLFRLNAVFGLEDSSVEILINCVKK